MKRLLAYGLGDIFYLGHVFRKGEIGKLHNPEFTMIEWYRTSISYRDFIHETCELIMQFIGQFPVRLLSYREAFQTYARYRSIHTMQIFLQPPDGSASKLRPTPSNGIATHGFNYSSLMPSSQILDKAS